MSDINAEFQEYVEQRAAELREQRDREYAVLRERELRIERNTAAAVEAFDQAFALFDAAPTIPDNSDTADDIQED